MSEQTDLEFKPLEAEQEVIKKLLPAIEFDSTVHSNISKCAEELIAVIRNDKEFGIEKFMQQFSLSTEEGIAVMCLAEGLLRVPDSFTAGEFVVDKLAGKNWQHYLKDSKSLKAGFTSYGLFFSSKFANLIQVDNILTNLVSKIGQPVFLTIMRQAIKFLGKEFIFGFDIPEALGSLSNYPEYSFSFDLLGESARTTAQAEIYYNQYLAAIEAIAGTRNGADSKADSPQANLSVKLTALYPRFELAKLADIRQNLLPKLVILVQKIRDSNLTITFDAEEAKRLDIYKLIVTELTRTPELKGFDGIGWVVQAYQTRALYLLDHIINLSKETGKKIPVRLVKGAYWDSEIKYAQELGLEFYPVFTKKDYTDASYIACAQKMFDNAKHLTLQFATHNAVTASTIIELAKGKDFEFQKLHGMGKSLHSELVKTHKVRIYAPIGKMHDLLAYLMRRMLENGANACFVNQVTDPTIDSQALIYNLHNRVQELLAVDDKVTGQGARQSIKLPRNIYQNRENPVGYDLGYKSNYDDIHSKVSSFYQKIYIVGSIIDGKELIDAARAKEYFCPADRNIKFANISSLAVNDMQKALESASAEFEIWSKLEVAKRANILRQIAQLYEQNKFELYSILVREAGKSINDAINEVIEAIDFCEYYANQAEKIIAPQALRSATGESNVLTMHARGVFLCISPWNFPLAIFTGQLVAALVCGNTVIAKPAEQTMTIANYAVKLMHKAGVPNAALQLVLASGSNIGQHVLPDERIKGVVFTGSTATAKLINMTLAARSDGIIPLIAETGGQNAMIVDSSALLEQVTDDVLSSAFYSAGQRCSALRVLYIQEEIYEPLLQMIKEAMMLLKVGDTVDFANDIGPVINQQAVSSLNAHIEDMVKQGFSLVASHGEANTETNGSFFCPHILAVNSINDIADEKFGPILHVVKYKASELDKVIDEINGCGFGLTFGIHTRIEKKVAYIASKIKVGNIYANRSIVGAKVESQPFGGENKSGTGFKAGGPHYLLRFMTERTTTINLTAIGGNVELLQ